jgi:hypothetical protein
MANVTYFPGFNDLPNWPGRLLEGQSSTSLGPKSQTSAVIKHGNGHPFQNYTITFAGIGFTYDGDTVTGGKVASVVIRNASGDIILQIEDIAGKTIAADFSGVAGNILGSKDGNGDSIGPNGYAAWCQLLVAGDTVTGTTGDDHQRLVGLDSGNDTYNLLGGDDRAEGGIGNDKYNGGDGFDTLSFKETTFNNGDSAFRGVNVNMVTLKVKDCWGGTDTLVSIEEVVGSRFADTFLGSAGEDQFSGLRGVDTFDGGANTNDKVVYYDDVWQGGKFGIIADLTAGTIRDGFGNTDTVKNVEWVLGTRFNDKFAGSGNRDVFIGDDGVDRYDGKGNPADSGEGDRIQFNWTFSDKNQTGIKVDLSRASGQIIDDGYGNTETAQNVEGIIGSHQNDSIKGDDANNLFAGADGKDTMTGGDGKNEYVWWDINHFEDGDAITDFDADLDKLSFDKGNFDGMDAIRIENDLSPGSNLGTFLFDNVADILYWDANGADAGQRFAIVKLSGVSALDTSNFELY